MHQHSVTTADGITIYIAEDATFHKPSEHTAGAKDVMTGQAVCCDFPIDEHRLPSRDWEYVTDRPWTWQTSGPYVPGMTPRTVAGFDPGNEAATAAAVDYIARYSRLARTHQYARAAQIDRERQSARAAAERIAARLESTPYGYDREQVITSAHRLGDLLVARGLLEADEITEIGAIVGYEPDLRGYGEDRPPVYYGPADVASARGVKRGTIDRYLAEGRLPLPDVTSTSAQLWESATIEDWLAEDIERR